MSSRLPTLLFPDMKIEDGLVGKKFLSANAHAFTCEHDYQTWWEILKLVLKLKQSFTEV